MIIPCKGVVHWFPLPVFFASGRQGVFPLSPTPEAIRKFIKETRDYKLTLPPIVVMFLYVYINLVSQANSPSWPVHNSKAMPFLPLRLRRLWSSAECHLFFKTLFLGLGLYVADVGTDIATVVR